MPKPDLTQTNTEQSESQENQETQEQQEQTSQQTQQQIDWENEQNIYKKRYSDSQAQVQPLVRTLQQFAEYDHQTRTWKPKTAQPQTQQVEDVEKILSGYDPEFVKAMGGYTQKQIENAIAKFKAEAASSQEYTSGVNDGRNKAISEFGSEFDFAKEGKMNSESPLYQLANEIIHNKYALFNPDGSFAKYNNPEAEYLATVEAYAILAKRSKQQPGNKAQLNAIQGKGTKAAGVRRQLSSEEYMKLPDAERDAYDLSQMGG